MAAVPARQRHRDARLRESKSIAPQPEVKWDQRATTIGNAHWTNVQWLPGKGVAKFISVARGMLLLVVHRIPAPGKFMRGNSFLNERWRLAETAPLADTNELSI